MAFPQSFLDELAARNDILDVVGSYVSLQPKGGSYWAAASSKNPLLHHGGSKAYRSRRRWRSWHQFYHGYSQHPQLPAEDEARSNADRLRRRVLELNRAAARWYYDQLQLPQGAAVQAYLDKRQIRRGIAVRFGMGASLGPVGRAAPRHDRQRGFTKQELLASGLVVNEGKTAGCTTSSATG